MFPYAACWRHYLELQLKSLLAQLRGLLDLPPTSQRHHRIDALWRDVKPLAIRLSPGEDKKDLAHVGRVVAQLAELDPDGQAFRYDKATDGSETLQAIDKINLPAFHEAISGVANYLDGMDVGLHEFESTKHEMESYYADEFGPSWSDFA